MKDHIYITRYLEGRMSEEEMEEVEVRCLYDSEFRRELQTMELLVAGIKESARETTLQEKLERIKDTPEGSREIFLNQYDDKKQFVTRRLFIPLAIAASLLLLLFVTGIIPGTSDPSNEQLFAQYFEVAPNYGPRQTRSGSNETFPTAEAYQAYDAQNYQLAAEIFEDYLEESSYRNSDLFHLGICYLVLEEWDQAISVLQEVAFAQVNLSDEAKWYLALAYLRTGQNERARALSQEIALPQERREKAKEIFNYLQ